MVSKNLEKAINEQVNVEFWSAYLYLSMSAHFANEGLMGFANWFKVQFQEEQDHSLKLMNYLIAKGNKVELKPIEKVDTSWESIIKAFEDTLAHEKVVTGQINNLVSLARSENDYATESMLQWFVNEQVEEEEAVQGMIDGLKLIGTNGFGIYTMDKELAQRTYTPLNSTVAGA
ncbi:MAG TPA: ferritin [Petrimonas sp.]|uniref:ferritin n=1 Tax=Petrimonas sp. TaxID=2023866 RepID=UPI000961CA2E|nr:ferritin [Petrimonas sp.]OJV33642.1 MAG: ferritin [Bacteroidia bacterium 43-41]HHV86635.1 ferritin [Petrimonas sp.]